MRRTHSRWHLRVEPLENRLAPAVFQVTTTLDTVNPIDGVLSLREAVTQANANPGADTVLLPAGVFKITRVGIDNTNALGDFDVKDGLTLQGAGARLTAIDAQQIDRVFDIHSAIDVTFSGVTLRNGNPGSLFDGGALRSSIADIWLLNCAVTDNRSPHGGGISASGGSVTLLGTTVARNVSQGDGGGINVSLCTLVLSGCTVTGNSAVMYGGGVSAATAVVTDSTVSGNSANVGGGIRAETATLTNSTVSGNVAINGAGGIAVSTLATLTDCTVSGNSASHGGGIAADEAVLTNCIVTANSASPSEGGGIAAGTATLTNCTVTGNSAGGGGGVYAERDATLSNCTISSNSARNFDGGGIWAFNDATLSNCTVSGNSAGGNGGGVYAERDATLTNCTVADNFAGLSGGGIFATNTATFIGCTLSGNSASGEGGGFGGLRANMTNCTVSGNSAETGGGIHARALTLLNVTVTQNRAGVGGGVAIVHGTSQIRNTIIAQNIAGTGPDLFGAFTSAGHNLIGDATGSTGFIDRVNGDMVGSATNPIDARLAPLADNGGPTMTHALLPDSLAIDHGDDANLPTRDQRGQRRRMDGDGDGVLVVDIGAFEL